MAKEKIHLEYMLRSGSGNIVWSLISTASGLETWFADKVWLKNKIFTFEWNKTEQRKAEITNIRANNFIRMKWTDDEDPKAYFEFRMISNELTRDYTLEITDFADEDEVDDQKELWDSQIEDLRRASGL